MSLAGGILACAQGNAANGTPATVAASLERVVPGAPFSADLVTERVQTLADGSHIKQTSTLSVARDSNGRVRHGRSVSPLDAANPKVITVIRDPVAGVRYEIDPDRQTILRSGIQFPAAQGSNSGPENVMAVAGRSLGWLLAARAGAALAASIRPETTSLGTQIIEGTLATGARAGMVVPAGQIGNEQPLSLTSELWYAPELGMVVLTRQSDPWMGETSTRLTHVRRGDPDSSLFDPPAGYRLLGDGLRGATPAQTGPRR
jgi:hypothetical protein